MFFDDLPIRDHLVWLQKMHQLLTEGVWECLRDNIGAFWIDGCC
uniref:Uncharacterized protein n=1 Tax=Arundo donax TaxID=35708 RepID=A0A0A8ZQW5_ARUDO